LGVAGLRLTPEEQFLVARMDGQLSVADLAAITGIEAERVEQVVSKLAFDGALDLDEHPTAAALAEIDDGGTTSMAEVAAPLGIDPSAFADAEPGQLVDIEPAIELAPVASRMGEQSTAEPDAPDMAPTEKNPVLTEEAAEELLADPTVA